MKKMIIAVAVVCAAAFSFGQPASADSLKIVVKPHNTVVKKVVVRQPCYYKTVKVYKANKTVITKKRICP
ncbi:hypothetical protein IHQ71_16720 [Rhizobium sp. TH2]|uniref:hypothetical protein n=1 Tax=Rhizobium sp. TH2 TaxID=2775403 RepID=UPI002158598B|nr:hypothetical protein [Rhizobium sp. TH2]UVC06888.1 hypothetical protein IHQ71_16720 [Rhizobium sp. TH2]